MLILLSLILYTFARLFIPKGNVYHEVVGLPLYWFRTKRISTASINVEKIVFGKHRRQYFLWLKPKWQPISKNQIIIYYHGGGWRLGSPEFFKSTAKVFTDLGYEVIMPSYRRTPRYNYSDIRGDINATLVAIREQMKQRNLTHKKLVVGGMSAGGNVAAHILYNQVVLKEIGLSQADFAGIFCCGAPLDLSRMRDTATLRYFAGERCTPLFETANPINYLTQAQFVPFLCLHGTKDGLVEYPSTQAFVEQLQQFQNENISFHTISEGTHLDAGNWAHTDNAVRKVLINWLVNIE